MSLSKEALELIQENTIAAVGRDLPALGPVVVVPQNFNVVDLERYQEGRNRFRGTYSTHSLADYSAYIVERAAP
ncbi:DUF2303 family protein, partial [Klebsiella pneumoniae]